MRRLTSAAVAVTVLVALVIEIFAHDFILSRSLLVLRECLSLDIHILRFIKLEGSLWFGLRKKIQKLDGFFALEIRSS